MGSITVRRCDDLPYGPGNPDYEYDNDRQRKVDAEMDDVRLCKDCAHFKDGNCSSPLNSAMKQDYVNGGETRGNPVWYGAQYCREDAKTCGPTARWWEAKS